MDEGRDEYRGDLFGSGFPVPPNEHAYRVGRAEDAILAGIEDRLLEEQVLSDIVGMTDTGIRNAKGAETYEDVKFNNLLGFFERGISVFKGRISTEDSDIDYQTLVRGVARRIAELDDVYASISWGVMEVSFASAFSKAECEFFLRMVSDEMERSERVN